MKRLGTLIIASVVFSPVAFAQTDLEKALAGGGKQLSADEIRRVAAGNSWIGSGGGVIWHPSADQRITITPKGEKTTSPWWVNEKIQYCLVSIKTNSEYCSTIVQVGDNQYTSFIKEGYADIKFRVEPGNSKNIQN